jgi:nucleoside-diphosphate-sugar epimerase
MRVFITGASGFIGTHLVPLLLQGGCEVAALCLPDDPATRALNGGPVRVITGDLSTIEEIVPQVQNFHPEACVHLAWYVEPGKYLDSPQNITCLSYSLRLIQLLIDSGCTQIVMTGTCAEYDTDVGYLKETSPIKPSTLYAASKLSLSILGQQLARDAGINFAWARIFYLYGNHEDPRRMVPALINSIIRDEVFAASAGEQIRDYLHVCDVASALWFLVERRLGGVYNVSSGEPVTVRRLMETIGDILGKKHLIQFGALSPRPWEPKFICGDNAKLCGVGWQPRFSLDAGLEDTVRWWQRRFELFP